MRWVWLSPDKTAVVTTEHYGRYQAGGFNCGRLHDSVYVSGTADLYTVVWLEIVGTTDAIMTSLRSYATRFDRAIITRSTCDMTSHSRALYTCTADCTFLLSDLESRCDYALRRSL